ncbi:pilus assembly protein [Glutamicibacter sp. NPDC090743]|uniref:pilus assembly protein n=1 Tax=Glutamicibacter sp. NPDC090743 TaxID=3364001 RepID=UPI00381236B3
MKKLSDLKDDTGNAVMEGVIMVSALLVLLGLLIVGIRFSITQNAVQQAANAAAREGSIARTVGEANSKAYNGAMHSLRQSDALCRTPRTSVDTSQYRAPLGQTGKVSVTVACTVPLSGLMPGLPNSTTVTKTASSPVDPYRQR